MKNRRWEIEIRKLLSGLTIKEVACRLRVPYQTARRIIREYKYRTVDGRCYGQNDRRKFHPREADWKLSNIALARQFKVSRERVRAVRWQLGKPRVESRGRPSKKVQKRC